MWATTHDASPEFAGLPRLEVPLGLHATGRQGLEGLGRRVEELDGDGVAGDEPADPVGDRVEHLSSVELGQDRLGDLQQLALAAELALEGDRLCAKAFGAIRVGDRLGREARVDHEQAQVVVGEAVQTEHREHDHAQHLVVEDHRCEEHRFGKVVLPSRDRMRPRIGCRIPEVLGQAMLCDPAGDALAHGHPQLVRRLVDVLADLADHRDRQQVAADDPVDPHVVIVDELPQLGGDREPDLLDVGQPVEPRPELLDRLELGGPRRHPLVVLRLPDRHAGLRRELADRVELVGRPLMRPIVVDGQEAEDLRVIEQRRDADRVEALLDDRVSYVGAVRVVAKTDREQRSSRRDGAARQRLAGRFPNAREVCARQPTADLGDGDSTVTLEEHRATVALEQAHRVVDEIGQDAIEIEPAADVAGDAPEGLDAVEVLGGLRGPSRRAHDRAETVGKDPGDVQIALAQRPRGLADDVKKAPRLAASGDDGSQLGAPGPEDRDGRVPRFVGDEHRRRRPAPRPVSACREPQRLAEDPRRGR